MDTPSSRDSRSPWLWVPSIYFTQGIPYVVVMLVSVILYKRLGLSNTDIALYTSWLYLPWVIKPLWSPLVELFKTKRQWVVAMQLVVGAGLGGVAMTIPADDFVKWTLAFFWLLAFSSATHDIAADGFYMLGLTKHQQTWFVGVRSTFYRLAMITGQGLLIMLAGFLETRTGLPEVTVEINARPEAALSRVVDPQEVAFPAAQGELRVLHFPESLELSTTHRDKDTVTALVTQAREWNKSHGFYPAAEAKAAAAKKQEASLWKQTVADPLEGALRRFFPKEAPKRQETAAGNVGAVFFSLSGPPKENVVVNFGRDSGDKSVKLLEGERFVFTPDNWNQPAMAVIQLDPKLSQATSAVFVARSGNIPLAWSITFYILAGLFLLLFIYHKFALPRPEADQPRAAGTGFSLKEFFAPFVTFFKKPQAGIAVAFLLLYRFAEAQLVKLASPFLLDAQEAGGLALTTGAVGFVYGTVGIVALTLGGLAGGFLAARKGLLFWLPWMVIAINIPNAVYIYLAFAQPESFLAVNTCVAIEQFGYGFGFAAYMLFMIYYSEGEHKTAHYAICTGFMALGMMIPGMFSGWLQDIIGYKNFFVWVLIATIPGFIVTSLIRVDPAFGKKTVEVK